MAAAAGDHDEMPDLVTWERPRGAARLLVQHQEVVLLDGVG